MRTAIALAPVLLACSAPTPPEAGDLPVLRVGGPEQVIDTLVRPLAEAHARQVGTIRFDLRAEGTAEGFAALLDGQVDVVAASRPHLPAEEEQARANGYSFDVEGARNVVAVDVVVLAVHPGNPLESLTYDQVIGVFCTRAVDSWSFLGLEERRVRALTLEPLSGTQILFEDFFCGPRGIHPGVEVVANAALRDALAGDPDAIGYTSLSEPTGKILGLRPDPQGTPIGPSQQNIIRGAYPLYRDVQLYTAGPAAGLAADFVSWIETPAGQEVVDEARYVPLFLRPERMDGPRPLRETVHFDPGQAAPNLRSRTRLRLLVQELRDRSVDKRHIVLEGYTDDQEQDPMELSRARAEAVHELLQAELPGLFFEIIPRGPVNPLAPNETPYGRQRNRRVQVYIAEEERPEGGG